MNGVYNNKNLKGVNKMKRLTKVIASSLVVASIIALNPIRVSAKLSQNEAEDSIFKNGVIYYDNDNSIIDITQKYVDKDDFFAFSTIEISKYGIDCTNISKIRIYPSNQ